MRPELLLKIGGTALGLIGGVVTSVWEVFLSPVYAGRVPLPVAPVLAVVGNVALIWFVKRVTGRLGLALLPGVVWFIPMLIGATKTTEGDVLIPSNDYMGLVAILAGAAAWGVTAYVMVMRRTVGRLGPGQPGPTAPAPVDPPSQPAAWSRPAPGARPTSSTRRRR
jgi:hypothetical protein